MKRKAEKAYELIGGNEEAYIGIILEYRKDDSELKAQSSKLKAF